MICTLEDAHLGDLLEEDVLRAQALSRLIQMYLRDVGREQINDPFRDRFCAFAEAYFLLAQSRADLFRIQGMEFNGVPLEALTQVLEAAVASEQLAPLNVAPQTAAVLIGINLCTLQQQLGAEQSTETATLTSTEAADLLTTLLFEGLQAPSVDERHADLPTASTHV